MKNYINHIEHRVLLRRGMRAEVERGGDGTLYVRINGRIVAISHGCEPAEQIVDRAIRNSLRGLGR